MGRMYLSKTEEFKRKYHTGDNEMNLNKITLLGRVGSEIETKNISDNYVAEFSMATSEKWKDKQGNPKEKTVWHNVQASGNVAKIISQYSAKGKRLYIEGKIDNQTWDKTDGTKGYKTIVNVSQVIIIDYADDGKPAAVDSAPMITHDDVPF